MNFEERISIFIKRFDCAMKTIEHFKMQPIITHMWGLEVKNKTFKAKDFRKGILMNPFAIIANGVKISERIYSKDTDEYYNRNLTTQYLLYQLGEKFNLNKPDNNALTHHYLLPHNFYQGINFDAFIPDGCEDKRKLYNTGLFLLNKHFGGHFDYQRYGFLK